MLVTSVSLRAFHMSYEAMNANEYSGQMNGLPKKS